MKNFFCIWLFFSMTLSCGMAKLEHSDFMGSEDCAQFASYAAFLKHKDTYTGTKMNAAEVLQLNHTYAEKYEIYENNLAETLQRNPEDLKIRKDLLAAYTNATYILDSGDNPLINSIYESAQAFLFEILEQKPAAFKRHFEDNENCIFLGNTMHCWKEKGIKHP